MADQLLSTAAGASLPASYIRPESQRPRLHEVMSGATIPTVDLGSPDKPQIVTQVAAACQAYGFFQVVNHGVPNELMQQMMAVAKEFFLLPPDIRRPSPQQERGQPARPQPRQEPPRHRTLDCFLCKGSHLMRDCPTQKRLAAIAARESAEDDDPLILGSMTIGAITEAISSGARLIFVPIRIRGVEVEAMVDTGATHLFVSERMAVRLDLRISPTEEWVKTVNTAEQRMVGISYDALVELGRWSGRHHIRVARMDDFDVILGYELLRQAKVGVMPHLGGVQVFHEDAACWISGIKRGSLPASTFGARGARRATDSAWMRVSSIATSTNEVAYIATVAAMAEDVEGDVQFRQGRNVTPLPSWTGSDAFGLWLLRP